MLRISDDIMIPEHELEWRAIRAQGPGGQKVNKASTAIHLRFDVRASSLPDECKEKLLSLQDQRITLEGVIVIKAQAHRSQEKNRDEALQRLRELINRAMVKHKPRRPTKPTKASREKRLEGKTRRGKLKALRGKIARD